MRDPYFIFLCLAIIFLKHIIINFAFYWLICILLTYCESVLCVYHSVLLAFLHLKKKTTKLFYLRFIVSLLFPFVDSFFDVTPIFLVLQSFC